MNRPLLNLKNNQGLIPTIIQDYKTNEVCMLGYSNSESLKKTESSKLVWLWSRSRRKLWLKGEQSGNKLTVKKIMLDCDGDTLLIQVDSKKKNICHTGNKSCFFKNLL